MNEATQVKLGFAEIRETIAAHCACGLGKRLALGMVPATQTDRVRHWLAQVQELLAASEAHGLPPLAGVFDIRDSVRASSSAVPLEPDALARIAETLTSAAHVRIWLAEIQEATPSLTHLRERVEDFGPLAELIDDAIDPRACVRDDASAKLQSIRTSIERARARTRAVFDRIVKGSSYAKYLQYSGSTFHGDRLVLPLKAEYRGRIPGIVHRVSDSGATLFVEPAESVELNNIVTQLREEERKEITRILRELTQAVHRQSPEILRTVRAIGVLDLIAAKCRYAAHRSCVCPVIDESGVLDLHAARHPVLIELFDREDREGGPRREVVPIDVRLGDDFDVMVITGPNTGGKTVAIKTIGLLAMMTQSGIPIPAGPGTRMPVFGQIFVDIGDEQSLQQSLSTFSSHLSNLLDILRHTGSRSLVLIDELGAGTDPDEGAAIGSAIIAELRRRGAKAAVTTHLSALKALAFTLSRVDNASVEFDVESLRPTFHVRLGEPGNSNAIVIAERLGMGPHMVAQAKEHLAGRQRTLNKAIAGTLDSRRKAELARKTARDAELESIRRKEEFERQAEHLRQERERFTRWASWVHNLEPGDRVYIRSMRKEASVVRMQLQSQTALVFFGAIDIEVPLRDIEEIPAD